MADSAPANATANPLVTGGRHRGRVPLVGVIVGSAAGYLLAMPWLVAPAARAAELAGHAPDWRLAASYAGFATAAGAVAVSVLFMSLEQLAEWRQYRRAASQRQQEFATHLGPTDKQP